MDEERSVNNVNQNNLEKIKHKKDKRSKKSAEGKEEAHNVDSMKATESARLSEKEGTSGVNRDHKRDKEKKKKKIKGAGNAEADMNNGSREGELTLVFGENSGGLEMDNAERNGENCSGVTVDNAGRKRKKRDKKKNKKFEMHDTEEAKWGESISEPDSGSVSGKESGKEVIEAKKKRKMKRTDIKDGEDIGAHSENCLVNATEMRKKRKNDERKSKNDNTAGLVQQKKSPEKVEDHTQLANEDGNAKTNHEGKKKKKHKSKENYNDDLAATQQEYTDNDTNSLLNTNETQNSEAERTNKRKKKKTKILKNDSDDRRDIEDESANKGKKRKPSLVVNGSDGTSPNKSSKKVRFSDQDEVFPLPSNSNTEEGHDKEDNLVRGKRFTQEEDELVKDAVLKFIEEHALGDEGLDMVLSCSKHPELRGCWKEIASAIPYRPYIAVYCRARILFMRSQNRKWTQEEYDMIKKYQEEHGNQWRSLADELGKHTWHVKDTWRRIKLPNLKKGHWSQEEYQKLFDLVNTDLQLKVSEEKRSKHGMLRDNICWTAISDSLSSRNQATCCLKWYKQMTSPMVAEGVWSDSDDYRLLSELYSLDATCLEDVEWDDLIENRPGDVCRKRWSQMVLHIGHHGNKSFAEQVEVLAQRYCPHLLEARETWDNKPRVP